MTGDIRKNKLRAKMRYRIEQMENLYEFTTCILNADLAYSVIDYA
jgi:hypothetical protein